MVVTVEVSEEGRSTRPTAPCVHSFRRPGFRGIRDSLVAYRRPLCGEEPALSAPSWRCQITSWPCVRRPVPYGKWLEAGRENPVAAKLPTILNMWRCGKSSCSKYTFILVSVFSKNVNYCIGDYIVMGDSLPPIGCANDSLSGKLMTCQATFTASIF